MSVKFSILVPAYNREGLIVECLQSIKNQSYTNYEVFFVDNESIDNTYNVALEFAQTYDKLQVYTAENIYPHCYDEAKELILPKCTGEYITIIADDDLIQNNYLKKLNSYIINNNYPQALQSPIKWFNHTTNKIMRTVGYNYSNITELKTQLLHHCCINTPTFTFHKVLIFCYVDCTIFFKIIKNFLTIQSTSRIIIKWFSNFFLSSPNKLMRCTCT